jgi:hypothetical protein
MATEVWGNMPFPEKEALKKKKRKRRKRKHVE